MALELGAVKNIRTLKVGSKRRKLNNSHSSPKIIRMIVSKGMGCDEKVCSTRERYEISVQNLKCSEVSEWEWGRAIAHAVSRRLSTAAARVLTRAWSCGILWWTKVALGQVFSENFGFPCTIYIPSASPQSSSLSPEVGRIGQDWPQCQ
jgi:hypothetical protein